MAFEGLHIGRTALAGNQLALDTIGKNITHANDRNFARQRVENETLKDGGVEVKVRQAVSMSLESDVLRETANLGILTSEKNVMDRIEAVVNELSDSDLSSVLSDFYDALEELSLNPGDVPTRTNLVQTAMKVTDVFHVMASGYQNILNTVDQEVGDTAGTVNSLLARIAESNLEITRREGSGFYEQAVDMRDTRRGYLKELSDIMNVTSTELSDGSVIVQSSGRTLVFHGEVREMTIEREGGKNLVRWKSDNTLVAPVSGKLAGLLQSRDVILPEKISGLDTLARDLAASINRVHNRGRGLTGISELTSETMVDANYVNRAMDIATVQPFSLGGFVKPKNGIITIELRNEATGAVEDHDIPVRMLGSDKMTLYDLKSAFDQVEHLDASVDLHGRLKLSAESGYTFFVKNDSSDASVFLGLNNFFSGANAASLSVSSRIQDNPGLVAAAKSATAGDNSNVQPMIATRDAVVSGTTYTLMQSYQNYVSEIATQSGRISSLEENQSRILDDVEQRRSAFSGVSLDEEAANLLKYQRSYQASARYISIQDRVLEILMSLI